MNVEVRRYRQRPVHIPVSTEHVTSEAEQLATRLRTQKLVVDYVPIGDPTPAPRAIRRANERQIHLLMGRMKEQGFLIPVFVDEGNRIIDGEARIEAARRIGLTEVPVIRLRHLSDVQKRALAIAIHKLPELREWDAEVMRVELVELIEIDPDVLELSGLEIAEIEIIADGPPEKKAKADPADVLPGTNTMRVTRLGDVWDRGNHRIACGSALEAIVYEILLGSRLVQVVFTDPPYNVKVDGHVGGLGKVRHREFAMASGEMSRAEFVAFLKTVFERMAEVVEDGAILFTCIDWAHLHEMLEAGHAVFDELKNIVCWAKTNGGMGSLYRSQHELIPVWKKGRAPHVNNIQLGAHGRYRTNVWTYAGANTFRRGRMEDLASHPTVKPCALVMDAIKDCSKPGGLVLDPFGGSGTTLIAAEKTRRHAYLIELDPAYVDLTIRRWEKLTGREAVHAETGKTFAETAVERTAASASPDIDATTTETEETSDD